MPNPNFEQLSARLLEAGIAPRRARRIGEELEDHYRELCADYCAGGHALEAAERLAARQLGPPEAIVASVASRPELRLWCYRYPTLGRVALPIAYVLALPAVPLAAGSAYMSAVARWGAIMTVSALITAGTFFVMQLSITLG